MATMVTTAAPAASTVSHHPPDKSMRLRGAPSDEAEYQAARALAHLFRGRSTTKSMAAILGNYAVSACCIAAAEYARGWSSSAAAVLVYAAAVCVIASRMRALENLVHEASHLNLFPTASTHYSLQFLYAFPVFRLLDDYRREHVLHHRHLGDPDRDPDLVRMRRIGLDRAWRAPVWYLVGLPLSGYAQVEYLSTTFASFWTSPTAYPAKAAYWAAAAATVWALGLTRAALAYHAVPLFLLLPPLRYWAEASEHVGLDLRARFGNSRSNLGPADAWFLHPHQDGYHAVHHLYAQVPFHQLPRAHEALMRQSDAFRDRSVLSTGLVQAFAQMASRSATAEEAGEAGRGGMTMGDVTAQIT